MPGDASKAYYERNKDEVKARSAARYEANKEEIKAQMKERQQRPEVKARRAEWSRNYRETNRKLLSDRKAANKFGIPLEQVQELRSITHCEICGVELQHYQKGGACIDHCHTTGKVRGILCSSCNKALGHFYDNPATLQQAILYLEERS